MKNNHKYGMGIRLPSDIIVKLKELKKEKELPSMAGALKFWLEQEVNDRTNTRLLKLEELTGQILTGLLVQTQRISKFQPTICGAFQELLGKEHRLAKNLREVTNCKGCPTPVKSKK